MLFGCKNKPSIFYWGTCYDSCCSQIVPHFTSSSISLKEEGYSSDVQLSTDIIKEKILLCKIKAAEEERHFLDALAV